MTADPWKKCLVIIAHGAGQLGRGDYPAAERALVAAMLATRTMPPEAGNDIRMLALFNLSLLRTKQGRGEDGRQVREQATAALAGNPTCSQDTVFQTLMAEVLMGLGEYRRAIPFCEQSIQLGLEWNNPFLMVDVLSRAAKCYSKNGLRDQATVPLREVVKILRTHPDDPRLPAALIALGNSLRKSSDAEAERLYQEAAAWHVSRAQLESATPAWVNLGVLYSETDRLAESLEHYQKALQVRERTPYTPRMQMGILLNNIANCYRRMERLEDSFQALDRAIELLTAEGGPPLAAAYGSRGLALRDQGRDEPAVEWFRKACMELEKQPSPNLELLAQELKNEADALRRLGRLEEAAITEDRWASVRAEMADIRLMDRDLSGMNTASEGAVLVHLDFGSRPGKTYGKKDGERLTARLAELAERQEAGCFCGAVMIPESTTLIFYGADGEALFRAMEPALLDEAMCRGAKVTIRQGERQTEVYLAGCVM